jgi:hypothetical protein
MISLFLFSGFRWYRKLKGGEWQKWWIKDPVGTDIWFHNLNGTKPALAVLLLATENYNPKYSSNLPYR